MRLVPRKKQTKKPSSLPKDFLKTVATLFQKQFKKSLAGSDFLVYGDLYPDEIIFCVSLVHPKSLRAVSLHISRDLPKNIGENPEKVTEELKSMVDLAASWFAQCFEKGEGLETVLEEISELNPAWEALEWDSQKLHVKVNRDNPVLEKAADKFLTDAGVDLDAEEISDEELDELIDEIEDDLGPIDKKKLH